MKKLRVLKSSQATKSAQDLSHVGIKAQDIHIEYRGIPMALLNSVNPFMNDTNKFRGNVNKITPNSSSSFKKHLYTTNPRNPRLR